MKLKIKIFENKTGIENENTGIEAMHCISIINLLIDLFMSLTLYSYAVGIFVTGLQ